MTRNGIFHNLKISTYSVTIGEYTFYFSSRSYLNKFMERRDNYHKYFNKHLKNICGVEINAPIWADISLYSNIEKRGFRINKQGEGDIWHETALLDGNLVNKMNLEKKSEDLMTDGDVPFAKIRC